MPSGRLISFCGSLGVAGAARSGLIWPPICWSLWVSFGLFSSRLSGRQHDQHHHYDHHNGRPASTKAALGFTAGKASKARLVISQRIAGRRPASGAKLENLSKLAHRKSQVLESCRGRWSGLAFLSSSLATRPVQVGVLREAAGGPRRPAVGALSGLLDGLIMVE